MTTHSRPAVLCAAALSLAAPAVAEEGDGAARMRAIVHRSYGAPAEVLRLEELERPVPNDDQILVRVRAAAVNPLDVHFTTGKPFLVRATTGLFAPESERLGVDMAGEVEAVGRNVTRFERGDAVFGHRAGAFGEYVLASERSSLVPKPPTLGFEEAAAIPVAGVTALQALRDAGKLRAGERVLVNGASGGVGTFAVQIAKALGAEVTGVCSTRNVELVRSLGADRVVDYTKEDFTKGGERWDLIVDMVGSHSFSDYRRVLAPDGRVVMVGAADKGRFFKAMTAVGEAAVLSRLGSQQFVPMLAKVTKEDLAVLSELVQAGKVKPVIDRRFALAQVAEAVAYVETGRARGKVVVAIGGDAPSVAGAASGPSPTPGVVPYLVALAIVVFVIGAPVAGALALNRRFQRRNPGKRPYRWGYYVALQALVAGILLAVLLEAGAGVAAAVVVIAAALAWCFARRRRWAWVALTVLTVNPLAWIVNAIYLRKRWREDAAAPAA